MATRPDSTDEEGRAARDEQLRQAEKTQALIELAGGVAHDFNNLLMTILGNSEMLAAKLEPGTPTHEMATLIEEAAQRAADLTRRLLAVARRLPLRPRPVAVDQFIAGLPERLRGMLGENIALELAYASDLQPALVDPTALETAIANLATNARDAMPDGGRLLIEARNAGLSEAQAQQLVDVAPGAYVAIAVTDTGSGMTPDVARRAFDPFFSSKRGGRGRGLGLSIVEGFARQSGGYVTLASAPGKGTTVTVYLPAGRSS
jgi:signal transduction histidine kinase